MLKSRSFSASLGLLLLTGFTLIGISIHIIFIVNLIQGFYIMKNFYCKFFYLSDVHVSKLDSTIPKRNQNQSLINSVMFFNSLLQPWWVLVVSLHRTSASTQITGLDHGPRFALESLCARKTILVGTILWGKTAGILNIPKLTPLKCIHNKFCIHRFP